MCEPMIQKLMMRAASWSRSTPKPISTNFAGLSATGPMMCWTKLTIEVLEGQDVSGLAGTGRTPQGL